MHSSYLIAHVFFSREISKIRGDKMAAKKKAKRTTKKTTKRKR